MLRRLNHNINKFRFIFSWQNRKVQGNLNYDLYSGRGCFVLAASKVRINFGRSGCDKLKGRGIKSELVDVLQITLAEFIIFGAFLSPVQIGSTRSLATVLASIWSDLLFDIFLLFLAQQENNATATNPTLTCCDNSRLRALKTTKSEIHLCSVPESCSCHVSCGGGVF